MLQIYSAMLRGNYLEWNGEIPANLVAENPLEVHVTILRAAGPLSDGPKMAEALEKLAALDAVPEIAEPVAWQRELRQDRTLPGRETE